MSLWKEATSFGKAAQTTVWLSNLELQQLLDNLTFECKRFGVKAPSPLSSDDEMENVAVSEWLEQGLVVRLNVRITLFLLIQTQRMINKLCLKLRKQFQTRITESDRSFKP